MKTVILFGATGLIGFATLTKLLCLPNHEVIAVVRSKKKLFELLSGHVEDNLKIIEFSDFDSRSVENLFRKIKKIIAQSKSFSIINLMRDTEKLKAYKISDYLNTEIDFSASIVHAGYETLGAKLKKVLLFSSIYAGKVPNPQLYEDGLSNSSIHYGIAKMGIEKLVKELAVRYHEKGVAVNAIAFGGVKGKVSIEFEEKYKEITGFAPMLEVEDCVGPIMFLISGTSNGITGHTLLVDNGYSLV